MTAGDDTMVRRYADAMQRRGRQITLRRITALADGTTPNPPTLVFPVLDGDAAAAATSIAIRASQAIGRLLAGDTLSIGGFAPVTIAADVTARALSLDPANPATPGFDAVTLASGLPGAAADGTAIVPTWKADTLVWASVQGFAVGLRSDQIVSGDLRVRIAAFGIAQPSLTDRLLIDGYDRSIVGVDPFYVRSDIAAWDVQAR